MSRILLVILFLSLSPVQAEQNFWAKMQRGIKKAFTPSQFICDKYERQEFERLVLKPGVKLAFTEPRLKKRHCVKWEKAPSSAIGRTCKEYRYENSSSAEASSLYMKVKRYRTVCVEGHSTK